MKPIPFKIPKLDNRTLHIQVDELKFFYDKLHFHPEFQITYIEKGHGILYCGNNMCQFEQGDIIMLGANLPHLLQCAPVYYTDENLSVKAISFFFETNSLGKGFFELIEMEDIQNLLHNSQRGFLVIGKIKVSLAKIISNIASTAKEEIIIAFIQLLSILKIADKKFINPQVYHFKTDEMSGQRLNSVLKYTFEHMSDPISIERVAQIANLSKSQFSRYFKTRTGKTYIQFLNELRVESACHHLKEELNTIEKVCYEVGFKNLSNFNRQFKKIKKITPSQYRLSRIKG